MWRIVFAVLLVGCAPVEHLMLLQDVEFLRQTIVENYPYLQVHQRRDNWDWLAHVQRLRQSDDLFQSTGNAVDVLSPYLQGLNGHVHLLTKDDFAHYAQGYGSLAQKDPQYAPWAEVLSRPDVVRAYGGPTALAPMPTSLNPRSTVDFERWVRGRLVYVKVPTFDGTLVDVEGPRIEAFLRQNCRADSTVVFDVRGNGGGSDRFWNQYLVRPLVSVPLVYTSLILYKGGEASRRFLEAKGVKRIPRKDFPPKLADFPDRDLYQFCSTEVAHIAPSASPIPHRRVVVLMDHANFSSSESFVAFCKQTGFALTVGSRSGGDGIGFDPILVELPFSHLVLALPICAGVGEDGYLDYEWGTKPEVSLDEGADWLEVVKKDL